jgi:hypothetical protein
MSIPVLLQPREPPLAPRAVVAIGHDVVAALALRLLQHPRPQELAAVRGDALLIVLGAELPWVDGVLYLGAEAACPTLLMPTTRATNAPADLVLSAFVRRGARAPLALLDDPPRVVSLVDASALRDDVLARLAGQP